MCIRDSHYPAINWTQSYSEYFTDLDPWYTEHLGADFVKYRRRINNILQEESQLMEIVKLIGSDAVSYTHLDVYKRQAQGFGDQLRGGFHLRQADTRKV